MAQNLKAFDQQEVHFRMVIREIDEELNVLVPKYDTKTLAISMMGKAAYMMRMLENMNLMTADEINRTVLECINGIHDPIAKDQLPRVQAIGGPARLS